MSIKLAFVVLVNKPDLQFHKTIFEIVSRFYLKSNNTIYFSATKYGVVLVDDYSRVCVPISVFRKSVMELIETPHLKSLQLQYEMQK